MTLNDIELTVEGVRYGDLKITRDLLRAVANRVKQPESREAYSRVVALLDETEAMQIHAEIPL